MQMEKLCGGCSDTASADGNDVCDDDDDDDSNDLMMMALKVITDTDDTGSEWHEDCRRWV